MIPSREHQLLLTRRQLFGRSATGIGAAALASLLNPSLFSSAASAATAGPVAPPAGSQQPGRPSFGAWLSYGLGSANENLPAFVVMISQGSGNKVDQPIFSRLWGSGFLPSEHQGVRLRSGADPVLYLNNPPGIDGDT